ncbi:MAG: hypothetical protein ACLQFR_07995 [Streptosporangiaceae bacterium]
MSPLILDGCAIVTMDGRRTEHARGHVVLLWRLDTIGHAGIADPVAALVLGPAAPLELLLVNGVTVVDHDRLVTVDEGQVAEAARRASAALAGQPTLASTAPS